MRSSVPNLYIIGTAVGGTQEKYTVFIENCHVHVNRVLAAMTGIAPSRETSATEPIGLPES
jgi:thioredoxin reductase (NADPH)